MTKNNTLFIEINDVEVPYIIKFRKIKYLRLEFKDGTLNLVVPHGFIEYRQVLDRHKLWIYRKFVEYKHNHALATEIKLNSARTAEQFQEYVESLITSIGNEIEVFPKKVLFRKMKTKWGSCSSKGNINLNSRLKFLPDRLIEYVVFHEMVHLIEMNHGPRFKEMIYKRFHDHQNLEKQLRSYSFAIMNMYFS